MLLLQHKVIVINTCNYLLPLNTFQSSSTIACLELTVVTSVGIAVFYTG